MRRFSLLLSLLLFAPLVLAQDVWVASIETDQAAYAYGEPIEVRFTVTNASGQPAEIRLGDSCGVGFALGDFVTPGSSGGCLASEMHYPTEPGASWTFVWQILPNEHGLPEIDGEQTLTGYFYDVNSGTNLQPETTFTAPRYLGGRLSLRLADGVTTQDVQDVIEALNATILEEWSWGPQHWEISGTTTADAVATYADDPRFVYLEPFQELYYGALYLTDSEPNASPRAEARLSAVYPNPLTASGAFTLALPRTGPVEVAVFDLLGRRVATLHEGVLAAEAEHTFTLSAEGLPSGVYFVRAAGDGFAVERRVTVLR